MNKIRNLQSGVNLTDIEKLTYDKRIISTSYDHKTSLHDSVGECILKHQCLLIVEKVPSIACRIITHGPSIPWYEGFTNCVLTCQ